MIVVVIAQFLASCTLGLNNSNLPKALAAKIRHSSIFHSLFSLSFFIISQLFVVFRPFGSLSPLFCLLSIGAPYLLLSPLNSGSCPHCWRSPATCPVSEAPCGPHKPLLQSHSSLPIGKLPWTVPLHILGSPFWNKNMTKLLSLFSPSHIAASLFSHLCVNQSHTLGIFP